MSQNTPTDLVTGAFSYSGAQIAEAALETLKAKGFAGASARAIADRGGFSRR